ncbi:DeoR family transcriptional regulator [Paenibacillus agilis]|uniref:DeoR/GlpR transcriptional regulator n=1 Tax=Paenibacillus agilis TaxID=3020863 RepID=A0A559J2I7_9BACL|nr:DeoR family transcriptional regulator [Paenibacillus agilis]TVX94100.1 DeoR/GlpR transcriptional regulator [Paenibacillus agilis]
MLPIERRQQILTWVEQEGSLRVSDISSRLHVSEMTVYRDIKPLIDEQKVIKTSNGIAALPHRQAVSAVPTCTYCYKTANTRYSVKLITKSQQIEHTCCAHCALLRYEDVECDVILCHDFLTDTTISAKMATFLFHADVNINCCQPTILTFDSYQQAMKFQTGFGGEIYRFEEAVQTLKQQMNAQSCANRNHL